MIGAPPAGGATGRGATDDVDGCGTAACVVGVALCGALVWGVGVGLDDAALVTGAATDVTGRLLATCLAGPVAQPARVSSNVAAASAAVARRVLTGRRRGR